MNLKGKFFRINIEEMMANFSETVKNLFNPAVLT